VDPVHDHGFVYTVAGSAAGTAGESNNGFKATSDQLTAPDGVTIDGNNNMYIADTDNCRGRAGPVDERYLLWPADDRQRPLHRGRP